MEYNTKLVIGWMIGLILTCYFYTIGSITVDTTFYSVILITMWLEIMYSRHLILEELTALKHKTGE